MGIYLYAFKRYLLELYEMDQWDKPRIQPIPYDYGNTQTPCRLETCNIFFCDLCKIYNVFRFITLPSPLLI